jgi:hypothetical protein
MSLNLTIPNILTTPLSKEEIWKKVNNGFYKYETLDRTLRKLVEEGLIERDGEVYSRKMGQLNLI